MAVGEGADRGLSGFLETIGLAPVSAPALGEGEAICWRRFRPGEAAALRIEAPEVRSP